MELIEVSRREKDLTGKILRKIIESVLKDICVLPFILFIKVEQERRICETQN